MITLDSIQLPSGLVWTDEFLWMPLSVTQNLSIDGHIVVQINDIYSGRPITLQGGLNFTQLTRADLTTIKNKIDSVTTSGYELKLHDNRTFQVIPTSVISKQVPAVLDSGVANPNDQTMYFIDVINMVEI